MQIIKPIPTIIVTGFLGSGKTSLISQWIKQKPEQEVWAVLVNEYGEQGIDGTWLSGIKRGDQNVFIKEVPGGCMCCAANLMAQVALNQLIQQTKPDRLIIEPSGLGHPETLIQQLSSLHYRDVINLERVITLLDARRLADERVVSHALFLQQIKIADILVASKSDLYDDFTEAQLQQFLASLALQKTPIVASTSSGIPFDGLKHMRLKREKRKTISPMPVNASIETNLTETVLPSIRLTFGEQVLFSLKQLIRWMDMSVYMRMKAVVITDEGIVAINHVEGETSYAWLDETICSQFEAIGVDTCTLEKAVAECQIVTDVTFTAIVG